MITGKLADAECFQLANGRQAGEFNFLHQLADNWQAGQF
jgi:hypothetical protein